MSEEADEVVYELRLRGCKAFYFAQCCQLIEQAARKVAQKKAQKAQMTEREKADLLRWQNMPYWERHFPVVFGPPAPKIYRPIRSTEPGYGIHFGGEEFRGQFR